MTVRVDRVAAGFRISDNGFAYREAECAGTEAAFARISKLIVDISDLQKNARSVFVDVSEEELYRAVCDVGAASWKIAEKLCAPNEDDEEPEEEETLTARLISIFGLDFVRPHQKLIGASTNPWPMTAVVERGGAIAAFQLVSGSTYSVYRTSSAFGDLADLEDPPNLVAVVPSKKLLGTKLGLLSRSGFVIEQEQPDTDYRRVVR